MTLRPDLVVIGAGPAGAFSAYLAAQRGLHVVIIERAEFPRTKICGCCIAHPGVLALEHAGLGGILSNALAIDRMRFATDGREAPVRIPGYRMIGRDTLDAALLQEAVDAGAEVVFGRTAKVTSDRAVELTQSNPLHPRAIVVADGLTGPALRDVPGFGWKVRPRGLVGLGTIESHPDLSLAADEITMAVGSDGYVGVAPIDNNRWTVAAAVDPQRVQSEDPTGAIQSIYRAATGRTLDISRRPTGVGPLTRTRERVESGGRIFLVGDACGYAEPMTGQGMSWALTGAATLAPIVARAIAGEQVQGQWQRILSTRFGRAHAACAVLTRTVRQAPARRLALSVASGLPSAGRLLASSILAAGTPRLGASA